MCLAQGQQHSDAGEARTCGPSVLSQALNHWATALPELVVANTLAKWKKWSQMQLTLAKVLAW